MKQPHKKLYAVFCAFLLNLVLVPVLGIYAKALVGYSVFTLLVVLLPLYVLYSKDALTYLAGSADLTSRQKRFTWLVACVPAISFGILSTGIGIAIVLWALYNFFIERQPEFSGPEYFGGFGLGPALVVFGVYTLKSLWVKRKNA